MPEPWNVRRFDREQPSAAGIGPGPYVILDNIRSAFNVGSIFRTCEAAGARKLYLCGISAHPPNPRVLKTSLGTEETLPWEHVLATIDVIGSLRRRGVRIVAVELTDHSVPYTAIDYPAETALVFGHEVAGVAVPILEASDAIIEIPMQGRKNSLNVATSVGVVLFEILRQRLSRAAR
jgi:tRNA G18 (ribose-2'-O)-methylase SpoU